MHNHVRSGKTTFPDTGNLMVALRNTLQGRPPGYAGLGSQELETRLQQFQKSEALGRATLGVAHEFNNLLGVIGGFAELLLDNPVLDSLAREEAGEIRKAAERATVLARQLLNFGDRRPTLPTGADLGDAVEAVRQILQCVVGSSIRLVIVPCPEPCPVRVSAGEIEQVAMNLVVNARDATAAGGQVMVATGPARLEQDCPHAHGVVPAGNYARLVVSDTGCGMDAVTRARLFEPFYSTKEPGKGTGLGLAIVAALLNQTGGYITLWSERGRGTRFEVYWPRADDQ